MLSTEGEGEGTGLNEGLFEGLAVSAEGRDDTPHEQSSERINTIKRMLYDLRIMTSVEPKAANTD